MTASLSTGLGLGSAAAAIVRFECEQSTHGVGNAGLQIWPQTPEFPLDDAGRDREQAMRPNRGPNLETGLGEAWILRVEHDVRIERLVGLAAGYERQHDGTMGRERLGETDRRPSLLRCKIFQNLTSTRLNWRRCSVMSAWR